MSTYVDQKVLEVLDSAGPVGAIAYGCALDGRDVSFDEVYAVACKQASDLNHPVQSPNIARHTYDEYTRRGKGALRTRRESQACKGWRFVQR